MFGFFKGKKKPASEKELVVSLLTHINGLSPNEAAVDVITTDDKTLLMGVMPAGVPIETARLMADCIARMFDDVMGSLGHMKDCGSSRLGTRMTGEG